MHQVETASKRNTHRLFIGLAVLLAVVLGCIGVIIQSQQEPQGTTEQLPRLEITFSESVSDTEKSLVTDAIKRQNLELTGNIEVGVRTTLGAPQPSAILETYIPVTAFTAVRQSVTPVELESTNLSILEGTPAKAVEAIAKTVNRATDAPSIQQGTIGSVADDEILLIPASQLTHTVKLLAIDNEFYLDETSTGAIFREAVFTGDGAPKLADLQIRELPTGEDIFTVNMSGVTALTRLMQQKLAEVNDPLHFSKDIGAFLADADLTHVSNEVSFKPECEVSYTLFCSPPEFIETLKASGVDLVEITGNHNNDLGSEFNTNTIELYKSLGWGIVGGGLNTEDAARPYVAEQKNSNVTFLAYNEPNTPGDGTIASATAAGANNLDLDAARKDIETAAKNSDFVIVSVQFWECYSYPDGYVEYPLCDKPIGNQESIFKQLIDFGADMVVGTSAHQPQTYELYNGKPIYYGLGNLYFDQTQWPGTERGIVLTHYFAEGSLLQTKLTPTVYGEDLVTRIMTQDESAYLLQRLSDAH